MQINQGRKLLSHTADIAAVRGTLLLVETISILVIFGVVTQR